MRPPNYHVWNDRGLHSSAHTLADNVMPLFMEAVRKAGPALSHSLFEEALWQVFTLPTLTPEFQKKNRWIQPPPPKRKRGRR